MPPTARQILSLDGEWRIRFDENNQGVHERWYLQDAGAWRDQWDPISVPSCWEEVKENYEGAAWYAREFTLAEAHKDRYVEVCFDAVNYRAEIWVNGAAAGFHDGGYTPFRIAVSDLVRFGKPNTLVVRVVGPILTRDIRIDQFGHNETPHWRGAIAGGIWQSVSISILDPVHIRDLFAEPVYAESRVRIHVDARNDLDMALQATCECTVSPAAGGDTPIRASQNVTLDPWDTGIVVEMDLPDFHPWSPEDPFLYRAEVTISDANGERDRHTVIFGMREFTIRNGQYELNGERFFMKAGFWEALYASTLANPHSVEEVERELRMARDLGFNTLRPWRKPLHPFILDLADRYGMCIIAAPPIECMYRWPQDTPQLGHRVAIEVRELVTSARNHPSVLYWELFNEVGRNCLRRLKRSMVHLARSHDPSRMVVDESGGWTGAHAFLPGEGEGLTFNELHSYLRAPVSPESYNYFREVGQIPQAIQPAPARVEEGLLTFISEITYGGLPNFAANVARYHREGNPLTADYRYHEWLLVDAERALAATGFTMSAEELCLLTQELQGEGNRIQLEAARTNPAVQGYCIHAFTDGDWVVAAGILDLWREKKLCYDEIKTAQQPVCLALDPGQSCYYVGRPINFAVRAANDGPERISGQLRVALLRTPGGEEEREVTTMDTEIGQGPSELATGSLQVDEAGDYTLKAVVTGSGDALESARVIRTYQPIDTDTYPPFAVLDTQGDLCAYLKDQKIRGLPVSDYGRKTQVLVVADEAIDGEEELQRMLSLLEKTRGGGTLILLRPPVARPEGNVTQAMRRMAKTLKNTEDNSLLDHPDLPWSGARMKWAYGNWVPVAHLIKDHPLLAGLPPTRIQRQRYENICPIESIVGLPDGTEYVAAGISMDWNQPGAPEKQGPAAMSSYRGPVGFWYGADLATLPHGDGKIVMSTFLIPENLGRDPAADRLLYNLVSTP